MTTRMRWREDRSFHPVALALVIGLLYWGFAAHSVTAQIVPERSDPPADQAVPVMPGTIELWFAEGLQAEGTTLEVLTADGTRVDMGDAKLDLQDSAHPRITVRVHPGLDNGVYTVRWTVVSALDGASASGSYRFTVDPGASPQALPQIATQQAAAPAPMIDENDDTPKTDRSLASSGIGLIIAGLVLLGLLLFWFLRRPARGRRWRDDVVDRL